MMKTRVCSVIIASLIGLALADDTTTSTSSSSASASPASTSIPPDITTALRRTIPTSIASNAIVTNDNLISLPQSKINLIKLSLINNANLTWEIGTHTEALIEFDYPMLSVFSTVSIPPPVYPYPSSVNTLAASIIAQKPSGILPLAVDGSSADPASMGVAILLANWTVIARNSSGYGIAAYDQVQYLLTQVPRTPDGAISHRADVVQLWADFIYMVPPFLAYYGALTHNVSIMQASFDQCRLYRNYLRDPNGLWRHIVLGPTGTDLGYWATGNAWAANGMLRTMATLLNSAESASFATQITELASWTTEILEAAFPLLRSDSLMPNYFNSTDTFSDAASTALLAATSYRLASLALGASTIPLASAARLAIYAAVNATTGVLSPVVDPLNFPAQGTLSPEGEAFVLIMEASFRDYLSLGGPSIVAGNVPKASKPSPVPSMQSGSSATMMSGSGATAMVRMNSNIVGGRMGVLLVASCVVGWGVI